MKFTEALPNLIGRTRCASAIVLASLLVVVSGLLPTPAGAITRGDVISRARSWVVKRVSYSQRSTFGGYRRDCSGFVSMAWRLRTSYTSRSIKAVARRIPISRLRAGDAVHTTGHVAIFVKWKSRAKGTYVAMEQSRWGKPALRRVRKLGRGATALRYRKIRETPLTVAVAGSPTVAAVAFVEPAHYQTGVLSSVQVSTFSDPSLITGYIGGGLRLSL